MLIGGTKMYRKPLINRIRNQITEQKFRLEFNKGNGKDKVVESIKRRYSLLFFLVNIHSDKVNIKRLENKFRVKLSGV